jgi:autotransporter passenger strand-loop-strand repeat protein
MDLFRYSAPGQRALSASSGTAFFSVNSGTTDLDNWNTNPGGDLGDWAASAGNDAYLAFSPSGQIDSVSPTDIELMNVLGWNPPNVAYVSSGQKTSGIVLSSGDILVVLSGGTTIGVIVSSGGTENVSSGGTANGTQVLNGGTLAVASGAAASGTTASGGGEYVASGGVVSATTLVGGGFDVVSGNAVGTIVNSGGTDTDYGVESATTVNGGLQVVQSGGTAIGTAVNAGSEEYVASAGTVSSSKLNGGFDIVFGTAVSTTVDSGSNDYDYGVERGTIINNGIQFVESGALASGTTVSGGEEYVFAGGTVSGTKLAGGFAVLFGRAVSTTITSNSNDYDLGVESGTTIINGIQFVESGAAASGTTVSGGEEYVFSGGTVSGTKLAGGFDIIFGRAVGTTISAASNDYDYGVESGTTILSGIQFVESGASASGTTVSGGEEYVFSGGTVSGTKLAGSFDVVFGVAVGTTMTGSGNDYDYGVESGTTVSSGVQVVESGGSASGTMVSAGGQEYVVAGGTVTGTTLNGGAGVLFGTAVSTIIAGGSIDYDYGVESGTTVSSGLQVVEAGAAASGTTVLSGGEEFVVAGGTVSGSKLNGGFDVLFGTAIGATLNSGGRDYVQSGGTDSAATVNNGGLQVVSAGGIARGDFVHSGGTEYIASGGFASGTTISGGVVEVASNAVTSGSLFTFALSGGGTLQLDDSQHFASTGLVAGFGPPKSTERIDFSDIPFVSGATTVNYTSGDAGNTSGTLIVSGGGHTASIELLGQYMAQQFQVTSDGHSGTLVTDPPVSSSSTMASLTTASPHH